MPDLTVCNCNPSLVTFSLIVFSLGQSKAKKKRKEKVDQLREILLRANSSKNALQRESRPHLMDRWPQGKSRTSQQPDVWERQVESDNKKTKRLRSVKQHHVYYQICVSIVTWVYAWDSQDASVACVHGVMACFSFQRPLKQVRG